MTRSQAEQQARERNAKSGNKTIVYIAEMISQEHGWQVTPYHRRRKV